MEYKTNYEILHVHELEEALSNLDEKSNSEEAEYVRGLIAQGGYRYPPETAIESAEITNPVYKWSLLTFIALMMIVNITSLIFYYKPLALVPITFQGIIVYMIFAHNKHLKTLIIVWSVLLIVAGGAGLLVKMLSPGIIPLAEMADKALFLVVGVLLISFSGSCIKLHEKSLE